MKLVICCIIFFTGLTFTFGSVDDSITKIKCYEHAVNDLINGQIGVELYGHYTYLNLAHFFLQNDHYYPKVSKYFREKADEEMRHAERFMEYQNQRGGTINLGTISRKKNGSCEAVNSLKLGFSCAKELEMEVTHRLTRLLKDISHVTPITPSTSCNPIDKDKKSLVAAQPIMVTCPNQNKEPLQTSQCRRVNQVEYVELAEMITHEFLGHQIEDTKELANFEKTLDNFKDANEKLGSFLADKHFDL